MLSLLGLAVLLAAGGTPPVDLLIDHAQIFDGSGQPPFDGAVVVEGDRITAVLKAGEPRPAAKATLDAHGLAVAPGFVNMLSWATDSLIEDGRSQGDLRQGVTLEVMGEGESMGPLTPAMKKVMLEQQGDIRYPIEWTTLGEYLDHLVKRGISCNVASFIGATTVRIHEVGYADRAPTAEELARMQALVKQAMEEGALGVASALIYTPGTFAKTDELVALCQAAAPCGGRYISHLRSEGDRWLESIDELIDIATRARIGAEIYHFKASGTQNWSKVDAAVARVETARAAGLDVSADMYLYTAGATGFDAAMPPWVQEGGYQAWAARLRDPALRARVLKEMATPNAAWESLYLESGGPDHVICTGFKSEALKPLTGRTLAQIAKARGRSAEETILDLVVEDGTRVEVIYFLMSEENIRREVKLPWMAFCSDAQSMSPEGSFLKSSCHPRAYGNVARLLGRYVRDEKLVELAEVIRRLTSFPCDNLKIRGRGRLEPDYLADIVVFDPAAVADHATFEKPHQFSTGVHDVFVNGVQVIKDGEHTGRKPGQVVRGSGWKVGSGAR